MSNTKPTPEHDFEVAKLQKQVGDIEKYRRKDFYIIKNKGDPSFKNG